MSFSHDGKCIEEGVKSGDTLSKLQIYSFYGKLIKKKGNDEQKDEAPGK